MLNVKLSIPGDTPICNPQNGRLNQEWRLWFNKLYNRAGSDDAPSNLDLANSVSQNTVDISTLKENVNTITTDLNNLTDIVNQNTTDINTLEIRVTDNDNKIAILQDEVSQNTSDITDLQTQVNINTADISSLNTSVADNTTDITALKANTVQTITNQGSGIGLFIGKIANTANFKSIKAGTNITLDNTTNPNELVINSSGGGGGVNEGSGSGHNSSVIYSQNGLQANTTGTANSGVGYNSLMLNTTGSSNTAMGYSCLFNNTTGSYNTGIGVVALSENTTGTGNIGIGLSSYRYSNANYQTGIGYLSGTNSYWDNTTCLGANTDVTGPNQVQIGSSTTTTYVYGTVQNRSDARDKADIKDGELGLDFIKKLKYKQWRWDLREDYKIKHVDDEGNVTVEELPKDGSKKRKRYHNGFIAQDIKDIMLQNGIDFGGYQDHNITNGEDVLSLGYDEFIGPLVKAIQEQQAIIEQLQKDIAQLKNINGV